jgi:glutamyl-Q tRNA(Asp) synthetase
LHLGHAYAAIIAHDAARASGGRFLLRIEDLDMGRARAEFEAAIHDDLAWLGLAPDAPAVRQSERMSAYRLALDELNAKGLLYPCFCTRKEILAEIAQAGAAPHVESAEGGFGPAYPGTCRKLSLAEREKRIASGAGYVLRLDIGAAIAYARSRDFWPARFVEAWAAGAAPQRIEAKPEPAGDIVLARKDMPASYHLAVVVDDAAAGISAVTRGEDLFFPTHIQVLLQRLLGLTTPPYGHHGLVRDESGRRLAKRDKARGLAELRAAGWDAVRVRAALPPLPDFAALAATELTTR